MDEQLVTAVPMAVAGADRDPAGIGNHRPKVDGMAVADVALAQVAIDQQRQSCQEVRLGDEPLRFSV